MKTKHLIIGSRSSKLAAAQSRYVEGMLRKFHPGLDIEIKTIKTTGDKILDVPLAKIGDKGLFTKEIENALREGQIDLAVHSMKDLPTELPGGLQIVSVPKREDPGEALVSTRGSRIDTLPPGSRVGTSSLRRRAQLLHRRRDFNLLDLRGNVDTRVEKLRKGMYDAIVLAAAGIKRLGMNLNFSAISAEEIIPQAGQGALGIEIRKDNPEVADIVRNLDDTDSHLSVDAERAVLAVLEGGCQVPLGVLAAVNGDRINIKAGLFSLDGKDAVKDEITGKKDDAVTLGRALAEKMLKINTVRRILDSIQETEPLP